MHCYPKGSPPLSSESHLAEPQLPPPNKASLSINVLGLMQLIIAMVYTKSFHLFHRKSCKQNKYSKSNSSNS